ncbi:GNAT family N-acetyltransferase [Flagellimonas meridianipacifica]|nr:GNAT family N-acetyltransferase [Allomuricauda pacifica]
MKIIKYSELDKETKSQLNRFIDEEFGHIPIVMQTEWATPDWTVILYQNNEIATFYNIIDRKIIINDIEVKIAGVNNVITPKKYRGNGYASKALRETKDFVFNELNSKFGVLLCAEALIPFYEQLDWYKVNCPVYFEQSDGKKLWKANTMLLTKKNKLNPKKIDLNGLPW